MMIRANNNFRKLVGDNFDIETVNDCPFPILSDELEIVEIKDCYYFKKFAKEARSLDKVNKMEYEFDTNKIRVGDLVKSKIRKKDAFWCGLFMVKGLVYKLQSNFGSEFEIVLSYDNQQCFISFYKIREGINNVMSEDIEGFQEEAILRIVI